MAFQKESFCIPKGLLLRSKRTRFALQKDSFCIVKGLLLKNVLSPFVKRRYFYWKKKGFFSAFDI